MTTTITNLLVRDSNTSNSPLQLWVTVLFLLLIADCSSAKGRSAIADHHHLWLHCGWQTWWHASYHQSQQNTDLMMWQLPSIMTKHRPGDTTAFTCHHKTETWWNASYHQSWQNADLETCQLSPVMTRHWPGNIMAITCHDKMQTLWDTTAITCHDKMHTLWNNSYHLSWQNTHLVHGSPVSAISHSLVDPLTPIALSLTPGHAWHSSVASGTSGNWAFFVITCACRSCSILWQFQSHAVAKPRFLTAWMLVRLLVQSLLF